MTDPMCSWPPIVEQALLKLRQWPHRSTRHDCESKAWEAMWRAWQRNPNLNTPALYAAARTGAIDGLRTATGWRRTAAGGMAREANTTTFSDLLGDIDPEWWLGYVQPEPEPEPEDRTIATLLALYPPPNPRDGEMIRQWIGGTTLAAIARQHGVSEVRVSQIAKHWARRVREQL